jgi:hypothetical protein
MKRRNYATPKALQNTLTKKSQNLNGKSHYQKCVVEV